MKRIVLFAILLIHLNSFSQELFVFTESASNMPEIQQQEIETMGHNSGYEARFIATELQIP
jgi:hypothetical protein